MVGRSEGERSTATVLRLARRYLNEDVGYVYHGAGLACILEAAPTDGDVRRCIEALVREGADHPPLKEAQEVQLRRVLDQVFVRAIQMTEKAER